MWELFVFFCSFSELLSFCFPSDHLQACCFPSLCQPKLLPQNVLSLSLSLPPSPHLSLSRSALTVLITNDHNTLRMPHRELVRTNPSDHRFGSCTVSISSLQIPHHPFPGVTTIRVDPPLSQLARWGES